ncbi:hypothetical protein E6H33_08940 [Candidatus Bathyarchaeota archaeon]|nr:MAG: hypothetical protein E6H33_08940 [Candidatus Bathyarchaeota archaeon]
MRKIVVILFVSVVFGLVGLAASSTREPWGVYQGFPFAYSYPNPITCLPNPFNGCGYYYDPVMIVLDYLFWLGTAAVVVSVISVWWNRVAPRGGAGQTTNDQAPPGGCSIKVIFPRAVVSKITFGSAVDLGFRSELLAPQARRSDRETKQTIYGPTPNFRLRKEESGSSDSRNIWEWTKEVVQHLPA